MLKQIERYTQVTGTSIYECDDKWQSNSENIHLRVRR